MISASTLPVARARVMPAAVAEARAVRSHAAARRTRLHPGVLLEPLLLLLTASVASFVLGVAIAGAFQA